MRKLVLFCFVVAVLSYVLGAILAWRNLLIDWDEYLKIVAVVGGLASVIGLLGLVLSPIRDLNSQVLKDLAHTTEEFERKQEMLEKATQEIKTLELKKEDLNALVEKASLSLYYKAELKRMYDKLNKMIDSSEDISNLLKTIAKMEEDAQTLGCEIERNKDISVIISTIQKANERTERMLRFKDLVLSLLGNQIIVRI
jgi:hypothetical protein